MKKPTPRYVPVLIVVAVAVVMVPCIGCFVFAAVLRFAGASDPEALAAGRAEITAYNERVAAVLPNVPDLAGPGQPCPAEAILAGHQQLDSNGRRYIPALRYETLQRWANGTYEPAPAEDAYRWLDSMERVDPAEVSDLDLGNRRWAVGVSSRQRYLAVFRSGIARAPEIRDEGFETGLFLGRMYVMDTVTGQLVCHAPFGAQNSESVTVGGLLHADDPDEAVRADLREQMQRAATEALRGISADLYLSTTPTIGDLPP